MELGVMIILALVVLSIVAAGLIWNEKENLRIRQKEIDDAIEIFEAREAKKEKNIDYSQSYQAKYLLTSNEWYEHKKLKRIAAEKKLIICPKVRLLDIIEPRKGEKNYKTLLYKIQSKHVDFLICDQSMHIKAILELDDNSHNQEDRQIRDKFIDQILTSVGYKVIRTHSITENTLDCLTAPEQTKNN